MALCEARRSTSFIIPWHSRCLQIHAGFFSQYDFLTEDLSSVDRSKTPWVVFAGHRPMYVNSGGPGAIPCEVQDDDEDEVQERCPNDQPVAELLRSSLEDVLVENKVGARYRHLDRRHGCGQDVIFRIVAHLPSSCRLKVLFLTGRWVISDNSLIDVTPMIALAVTPTFIHS